jgi:hypothetical protein
MFCAPSRVPLFAMNAVMSLARWLWLPRAQSRDTSRFGAPPDLHVFRATMTTYHVSLFLFLRYIQNLRTQDSPSSITSLTTTLD